MIFEINMSSNGGIDPLITSLAVDRKKQPLIYRCTLCHLVVVLSMGPMKEYSRHGPCQVFILANPSTTLSSSITDKYKLFGVLLICLKAIHIGPFQVRPCIYYRLISRASLGSSKIYWLICALSMALILFASKSLIEGSPTAVRVSEMSGL